MRLRTTAFLLASLVAGAAGCANDSGPPINIADSPPAASTTPSANRDQPCEAVFEWEGITSYDFSKPAVRDFYRRRDNPDQFSVQQQIAIRRAYFTFQEKGYRSLAATASGTQLRTALQSFADGWAELAQDTSVDGPPSDQPDRTELNAHCPRRLIGVATPAP